MTKMNATTTGHCLEAIFKLGIGLALLSASPLLAQKQPANVLANFGPLEGQNPVGGLTAGPGGFLFGVTAEGGQNREGALFRFKGATAPLVLASFGGASAPGAKPSGPLLRGPDGLYYGVTENGGASGLGAVVRYSSTGVGTLLASFTGAANGSRPVGWLVRDKAGSFYGVTREGGLGGHGTVFKLAKDGTVTRLVSFTNDSGDALGRRPAGGLALVGSDLYGVAEEGGGSGRGVLFKVTTAGAYTMLHAFTATGLRQPVGGLTRTADGALYGVAFSGSGAQTPGAVFRLPTSGPLEVVKNFTGSDGDAPGAFPGGGLVLGPGGALYGVTSQGGASNNGVVFRLTPAGEYTALAQFTGTGGERPGDRPTGRLLVAGSRLLGVTSQGGLRSQGTLFEVTTGGAFKSLHAFRDQDFLPTGVRPLGPLARGPDGSWYGLTVAGGEFGFGTAFKVTAKGRITGLFSFTGNTGAFPGGEPVGGLVAGPDGRFYGTTKQGGANGGGTVFAVTPQGQHTVLFEFSTDTPVNGSAPEGPLIVAADGRLVGTTRQGGVSSGGVVFAISTTGVLELLANMNSIGSEPREIMQAPDGTFYGLFRPTGNALRGLFKLTSDGTLSTFVSFTGGSGLFPGSTPQGTPVLMPDGKLYGVTRTGGSMGRGVIYRVTTTGDYEVLRHITNDEGFNPVHGLTLGNDGWLYGQLEEFGSNNRGVVFRINSANVYQRLKRWAPNQAQTPGGPFVRDPQGRLFAVAQWGGPGSSFRAGVTGSGAVFFVDPRNPIPLPDLTVLPPTNLTRNPNLFNFFSAFLRARVNPRGFPVTLSFITVRSDALINSHGSLELPGRTKAITTGKTTNILLTTGFSHTVRVTATNEFGSTVAEWSPLVGFNRLPTAQDLVFTADTSGTPHPIYSAATHTTDADGTPRTLSIASYDGAGTVTTDGSTVTYTGVPFSGTEIVTIRVDDGSGGVVIGHVHLISGTGAPIVMGVGSPKPTQGTRYRTVIANARSFGTPTQFGPTLITYGSAFYDVSRNSTPKWQALSELMVMGLPGSGDAGLDRFPSVGVEVTGVAGRFAAVTGEFVGRAMDDFSKWIDAYPAIMFGSGVTSATQNAIVWGIRNNATSLNSIGILVRQGDPAPDAGGAEFSIFTGLLVPGMEEFPVVVAKLRSGSGAPVTKDNDTGVWGTRDGQFRMIMRTGDSIAGAVPPAVLKSITLPQTVPGSAAERRHDTNAILLPLATFTEGSKGLLATLLGLPPQVVLRTGQEDGSGREILALGFADFDVVESQWMACLRVNWRPGKGGVTLTNDTAIVLANGLTQSVLVRESDDPPGVPGAEFASFNDPIAAAEFDGPPYVAFEAGLRGGTVNKTNDRGLWVYPRDGIAAPYLLARTGSEAPGTGGAVFDKFDSMASLSDMLRGVAFTASLRGNGVNKGNNYGLWAHDNGGQPVLIFRTGQKVPAANVVRTVKSFTVMKGVPVSAGQDRTSSFGWGTIALRAEFTDGTQALLSVALP